MHTVPVTTPKSVRKAIQTRHGQQAKRDYNREKKREERANHSNQKKIWIRKKDRERKAEKRKSKKQTVCSSSLSTSPFRNIKTEWNITSKVRAMLPKPPEKFAKVVDNIEKRATPRKRKALDVLLKADSVKKKKAESKEIQRNMDTARLFEKKTTHKISSVKASAQLYLAKKAILKRQSRVDVRGIRKFYLRDDISRILPQKRYATKEGPGYAMQVSVKAAHAKYNFENPKLKVSLGKFAALRKRNVRLLSQSHRDYCCCPYCTNIRFKLLTLSRASPDQKCKKTHENDIVEILLCPKADSDQFHDTNCINGDCDKCSNYVKTLDEFYSQIPEDKILTWNRWMNDTNIGKGMVKKVVITEKGYKNKLIQEMVEKDIKKPAQGYTFFQHMFTAQWQNLQFRQIKAHVPAGSVLQVMDFAKNREIKYQSEIKGAFYTARQVTMHPVVTYFQSDVGLVRNSSIIISEDNCHDYHAVNHFQNIVNRHIGKFIEPNRRIIFSDGCSSQYKSKGPFSDIANDRTEINRNYFGSEHGKNECDGEIGVLNRNLDRAIIGNVVVLNSAEDVYDYCHSYLEVDDVLSTRNFFYVKIGDINRDRPETAVKTVPSTRKFHQILNSIDEHDLLRVRNLSCFCIKCESGDLLSCLNGKYVGNYEVNHLERNAVPVGNTQENVDSPNVLGVNTQENVDSPTVLDVNTQENVDSPTVLGVNAEENYTDGPSVNVELKLSENESPSRKSYFEKILNKVCQYKSLNDLQTVVPVIEQEIKELYGDLNINPDVSIVSHGLTVDKVAHAQDCNYQTVKAVGKLPACVLGDGNCLPRSGSVLAFGDEDHHPEIRCRIFIEMLTHMDLYTSIAHLKKGTNIPEKEIKHLLKTYAMFSSFYLPGKRLVPRNIYLKELMETCRDRTYMGIWHIFALSSILHCRVYSMYPELGSELYSTALNRLVIPRIDHGSGIGHIMWSSTRKDMNKSNWIPNHFVPVLSTAVTSSRSLDGMFEDEEDDIMIELDSSTLSGILTDLNVEELTLPDIDILENAIAPDESVSRMSPDREPAESIPTEEPVQNKHNDTMLEDEENCCSAPKSEDIRISPNRELAESGPMQEPVQNKHNDTMLEDEIVVTVAGLKGVEPVTCSRNVKIVPDVSFDEAKKAGAFDVVVLPGGGPGAQNLADSAGVGEVLQDQEKSGRLIAAVCAAPIALASHKIASGKQVTSHPSVKDKLVAAGYQYSKDRVVQDGKLITSRGPGTCFEFALKIVEVLEGADKANSLVAPMLVKM